MLSSRMAGVLERSNTTKRAPSKRTNPPEVPIQR